MQILLPVSRVEVSLVPAKTAALYGVKKSIQDPIERKNRKEEIERRSNERIVCENQNSSELNYYSVGGCFTRCCYGGVFGNVLGTLAHHVHRIPK